MEHKEYNWITRDGLKIYAQSWEPDTKSKAAINLAHGFGEHSTRYEHWAEMFVNEQYTVISFDHRGHGKSEGKRGHSPTYEHLMDDMDIFFSESEILFPDLPKILYGHSMGGNIAINYAIRRNPKIIGLIATSPWLQLAFQPPKMQLAMGKLVSKLFPALVQKTGMQPKYLSKNELVVNKYVNDELVHDKISAALFVGIYKAGNWAIDNASEIKIPMFLMHGGADKITSHKASMQFAAKVQDFATIKIWEDLYHELHNEDQKEEIFQYLLSWIEKLMDNHFNK